MSNGSARQALTALVAGVASLLTGCVGAQVTSTSGTPPPTTSIAISPPATPGAAATTLAAGTVHTCVVTRSGGVSCWGDNEDGQLGDGTTTRRRSVMQVSGLSDVRSLTAGVGHTCVLTGTGGVMCWGANADGQLGDGSRTRRLVPVDVAGLAAGVRTIAAGAHHTCAATGTGTVLCWGAAWGRAYADGERIEAARRESVPTAVNGLDGVVALAAGESHTCALTSAGELRCWGWNGDGQLGDTTTTSSATPVTVAGGSGVRAVSAGWGHTCAIAGDTVSCWGANESGQLGDGTTAERHSPTPTVGLASAVAGITAGDRHTCALLQNGAISCWGDNSLWQLGAKTTEERRPTPIPVPGLAGPALEVAAGGLHTCALEQGLVQCWGSNEYGQLAAGSSASQATAVDVLTLE